MAGSFFFYDLETSGVNARRDRIMQFASQRTDLNLKPIGESVNVLIKLTPDILPDPGAILLTGITPQQTIAEGLSEAEFLKVFSEQVLKPDTIYLGFNSIRFDDEFMRFLFYRNFYDPYEWHWQSNSSRWDLLDAVRMMRALRPDGIKWPFASDGKPANRLGMLSKINKLDHASAHDALSDVQATIALAQLIRSKQPDLFDYLLKMRSKREVAKLVEGGNPFVYTSSHYPSSVLHTTVVATLSKHPQPDSALVYDLRHDPTPFLKMNVNELVAAWRYTKDPEVLRLPVKTLKYNRSPAIAPLGVIKEEATQARIDLSLQTINRNLDILKKGHRAFTQKVLQAIELLDEEREKTQTGLIDDPLTVDERLYDGFIDNGDKQSLRVVRAVEPDELSSLIDNFHDKRLKNLLPLYKARNYPRSLNDSERNAWDSYCHHRLMDGGENSALAKYFNRLEELTKESKLSNEQQYLVEELKLYGQSIVPSE